MARRKRVERKRVERKPLRAKSQGRRSMRFRGRRIKQRTVFPLPLGHLGSYMQPSGRGSDFGFEIVNDMEVLYRRELLTLLDLRLPTEPENFVLEETMEDKVVEAFSDFLVENPGVTESMKLVRDHLTEMHFLSLVGFISRGMITPENISELRQLIEQGADISGVLTANGILDLEAEQETVTPQEIEREQEFEYETENFQMEALKVHQRAFNQRDARDYVLQLATYADALHDFGKVTRMGTTTGAGALNMRQREKIVRVVTDLVEPLWTRPKTIDPYNTLKTFMNIKNAVDRGEQEKHSSHFCIIKPTDLSNVQEILSRNYITSGGQILRDASGSVVLKRLKIYPPSSIPFERAFDANGPDASTAPRTLNYDRILRPDQNLPLPELSPHLDLRVGQKVEPIDETPENSPAGSITLWSDFQRKTTAQIGQKASVPTIASEIEWVIRNKGEVVKKWNKDTKDYVLSLLALKRAGDQGQAEYIQNMNQDQPSQRQYFFETGDYFAGTYALARGINLITSFTQDKLPYFYLKNFSEKITNNDAYHLLLADYGKFTGYVEVLLRSDPEYLSRVKEWLDQRILEATRIANDPNFVPSEYNFVTLFGDEGKIVSTIEWTFKLLYRPGVNLVARIIDIINHVTNLISTNSRRGAMVTKFSSYIKTFLLGSVDGNYHRSHMEAFASVINTFGFSYTTLKNSGFPIPLSIVELNSSVNTASTTVSRERLLETLTLMKNLSEDIYGKFGLGKLDPRKEGFELFMNSFVQMLTAIFDVPPS